MKQKKIPITEVTISNKIGRPVSCSIRMTNLKELRIQPHLFLETFSDFFEKLPWEKEDLDKKSKRKNVTIRFGVSLKGVRFFMAKEEGTDFPIDFFFNKEFLEKRVHHLFGSIFSQYYKFIKNELARDFVKIEIQFLREKIADGVDEKKLNSNLSNFEGSQVILHRKNIIGGNSQILERDENGLTEILFQEKLEPGDFVFLKNRNGNMNKVFHQLSPIRLEDESRGNGWIDLIRFEIIDDLI